MFLHELFEGEDRPIKKIGSIPVIQTDTYPSRRASRSFNELGRGMQTASGEHKSGRIVKYTDVKGTEDPFVKFVNICMFNAKNPWLPTYYTAKIYMGRWTSDNWQYVMVSTAKKLHGNLSTGNAGNSLAKIELSPTGEKEVARWNNAQRQKEHDSKNYDPDYNSDRTPDHDKADWIRDLFHKLDHTKIKKAMHMFNDKDLLQALDILDKFPARQHDMHGENFMWDGDHLVINDPVFDDSFGGDQPIDKTGDKDAADAVMAIIKKNFAKVDLTKKSKDQKDKLVDVAIRHYDKEGILADYMKSNGKNIKKRIMVAVGIL